MLDDNTLDPLVRCWRSLSTRSSDCTEMDAIPEPFDISRSPSERDVQVSTDHGNQMAGPRAETDDSSFDDLKREIVLAE